MCDDDVRMTWTTSYLWASVVQGRILWSKKSLVLNLAEEAKLLRRNLLLIFRASFFRTYFRLLRKSTKSEIHCKTQSDFLDWLYAWVYVIYLIRFFFPWSSHIFMARITRTLAHTLAHFARLVNRLTRMARWLAYDSFLADWFVCGPSIVLPMIEDFRVRERSWLDQKSDLKQLIVFFFCPLDKCRCAFSFAK